tara:strand:- start:607 stop:903 length:297 start_codon:yes stop_codon:yes gene_type:complete
LRIRGIVLLSSLDLTVHIDGAPGRSLDRPRGLADGRSKVGLDEANPSTVSRSGKPPTMLILLNGHSAAPLTFYNHYIKVAGVCQVLFPNGIKDLQDIF